MCITIVLLRFSFHSKKNHKFYRYEWWMSLFCSIFLPCKLIEYIFLLLKTCCLCFSASLNACSPPTFTHSVNTSPIGENILFSCDQIFLLSPKKSTKNTPSLIKSVSWGKKMLQFIYRQALSHIIPFVFGSDKANWTHSHPQLLEHFFTQLSMVCQIISHFITHMWVKNIGKLVDTWGYVKCDFDLCW